MRQPEKPEHFGEVLTPVVVRRKAMDMLARREYSRYELADKLITKLILDDEGQTILAAVLEDLIEDDLLSDQRFAEALVRSKVHKGQGPRRIVQTLQQRGVSAELTSAALAECDTDWYALAAAVAYKKYGGSPVKDVQAKAKRSRFLQYRGFKVEQIAYALSLEGVEKAQSK